MKSSSYIDLQRFMLIPTKFPLTLFLSLGKEQKSSVQSTLLSSDGSGKAFYGEYVNARYA